MSTTRYTLSNVIYNLLIQLPHPSLPRTRYRGFKLERGHWSAASKSIVLIMALFIMYSSLYMSTSRALEMLWLLPSTVLSVPPPVQQPKRSLGAEVSLEGDSPAGVDDPKSRGNTCLMNGFKTATQPPVMERLSSTKHHTIAGPVLSGTQRSVNLIFGLIQRKGDSW